jgi:hypothetical protein
VLRIRDVGAYLGISQQRAAQMYHERRLPKPERVDSIGPLWEAGHDRAMSRTEVVGDPAMAKAPQ